MSSRVRCLAGLLAVAPAAGSAATTADEAPAPLHKVGEHAQPRARLTFRPWATKLTAPISMSLGGEAVGAFPVDAEGTRYAPDPAMDAEVRAGASFSTADALSMLSVEANYEHDLHTGWMMGGTERFDGVAPPFTAGTENQLRKAYGRVGFGPFITLTGGYMTSHWGLGLLANDGAHGFEPGSARFAKPRGGDRVLRGAVATGPWTGGKVLLQVAYDQVQGDDVLLYDDEATQLVAALIVGYGAPRTLGLYGARRHQKTDDGRTTDVTAIDAYGRWTQALGTLKLTGEFEAAYLTGDTELSPTPEHVRHDLRQFGAVGRVGLDAGCFGGVLDVLYASGDQNQDDAEVNAFKADPNFEMGLFLYRHVLAAMSSRAPVRAADPELVGRPAPDLDRLPTRGSVTNTLAFFPRAYWRPVDGLEVFGGPLLALSAAQLADPRNTRLAGGDPHNAFDAEPGRYLGTELDAGVRYSLLFDGMVVSAGLEGGVLLPGGAFVDADGNDMASVAGGRSTLRLSF